MGVLKEFNRKSIDAFSKEDRKDGSPKKIKQKKSHTSKISPKDHQELVRSFINEDSSRGLVVFHGLGTGKTFTAIFSAETFLKNAMRDPYTDEIGKSLVFCVSQAHAAKVTQQLNILADKLFPKQYSSDFAVQVTSNVQDAQNMTINFRNNNLSGQSKKNPHYRSSKTRVCVTVGMMTTGYD